LKERAIMLSAALLKLSGKYGSGTETEIARSFLENGLAYKKFLKICEAQGDMKEPAYAKYHFDVKSELQGVVKSVDNRKLARIAKLAGAPQFPSAGILYNSPIGKKINKGDILFTIYAESNGELEYAKEYLSGIGTLIEIG
ncbi:MAG TPA: thymidine phosphorylase, partial [Bacteroidia bacterium]|nr:thymidine phosphorylase [Bacteroidia bacterium]